MAELDKFKRQYLILVNRLTDQVFQLINAGQTKDQILAILGTRDFKKVIFADAEFKSSYNELNKLYAKALKNMDKFADISSDALLAITQVNKSTFFDKMADDIARSLKGNITNGILGVLTRVILLRE